MNKISKRLKLLSMLVDQAIIADIGCDHGKLVNELMKSGKIEFAYISDISKPSLQKAIELNSKYPNIEAICCDGLQGYSNKIVNQAIISGMGGDEIIKIITASPIEIESFILSPQHNIVNVKKFMLERGYDIVFDIIIQDKSKFYHIFKCNKSNAYKEYSELELAFGKDSFINDMSDLDKYIDYELSKLQVIRGNLIESNEKIDNKIDLLEKAKRKLKL